MTTEGAGCSIPVTIYNITSSISASVLTRLGELWVHVANIAWLVCMCVAQVEILLKVK